MARKPQFTQQGIGRQVPAWEIVSEDAAGVVLRCPRSDCRLQLGVSQEDLRAGPLAAADSPTRSCFHCFKVAALPEHLRTTAVDTPSET